MPSRASAPRLTNRPRTVVALAGSLVAAGAVLGLAGSGLMVGAPAVVLAAVCLVAVPTSISFARRIAINVALLLGLAPLFWWVPMAPVAGVGRSGMLLAIVVGALVFLATSGPVARARLLPAFRAADAVILAAAGFAVWFLLPLLSVNATVSPLAVLVTATGSDNAAHFDMFEMIRVLDVAGHFWGASADGSPIAYVTYPQHFHVLVAGAAELWGGVGVGSFSDEAALYLASTALILVLAFVALCAALVDIPWLRRRVATAAIPVVAAACVLFLGFGATALSFGFAGFILAVLAATVALLIGFGRSSSSLLELAAVAALVCATAHTWSLLTPVAGAALLATTARLPWTWLRRRPERIASVVVVWVVCAAVVVFAAVLVLRSTAGAGSPEQALATPGGVLAVPIVQTALRVAILALAVGAAAWLWRGRLARRLRPFASVAFGTAMALVVGVAIIGLQLARGGSVGYFQYKLSNGLFIMSSVVVFAVVAFVVARGRGRAALPGRRVIPVVILAGLVMLADASTAVGMDGPGFGRFPGLAFRASVETLPLAVDGPVARIQNAAIAMGESSCERPIFIAADLLDLRPNEANHWAMALSHRWSEAAGPIDAMLARSDPKDSEEALIADIDFVLGAGPEHCVLVSPSVYLALPAEYVQSIGARLATWSAA